MHYKNGREAKNGDKVMWLSYGGPVIGILHDAKPGNDCCNGQLALLHLGDPCPNLKECLHLDDALKALAEGEYAVTPCLSAESKAASAGAGK